MTVLGLAVTGALVGLGSPGAHAAPQGSVAIHQGRLEVANPVAGIFRLTVQDGFVVAGQHHPETAVRVGWFGGGDGGFVVAAPECLYDEPTTVYCPIAGLDSYVLRASNQGDFIQVDVPLDGTVDAGGGSDHIEAVGQGADEIIGGPGLDGVWFPDRSSLALSLDDVANDGQVTSSNQQGATSTEHDNLHSDVEIVHGTESGDILIGNGAANALHGEGGSDRFFLGAGADDTVVGGAGSDTALYHGATTGIEVRLDGVANDGLPGQHSDVGADVENVRGTPYNDVLIGNASENLLEGGPGGSDTLSGLAGADVLDARASKGLLDAGEGDDLLYVSTVGQSTVAGGPGSDEVSYNFATAPVTVKLDAYRNDGTGSDLVKTVEDITGGPYADTLVGDANANVLQGNWLSGSESDNDVLTGGGGNDTFAAIYNQGRDTYAGGPGVDHVDFSGIPSAVTVSLDGVANDFPGQSNVKTDVENVTGGAGADDIVGSRAANRLVGGPGADRVSGGQGVDVLIGGTGADTLAGGPGLDTADYADRAEDLVLTLEGTADDGAAGEGDNVQSDVENVIGGSGSDLITGSDVANVLLGGDGADEVVGGGGKDKVDLGAGPDYFHANTFKDGGDDVAGGAGQDIVSYGARSVAVTVTLNNTAGDGESLEGDNIRSDVETVIGGSAGDKLTASTTGSELVGRGGNDTLVGGAGNDRLDPGTGNDDVKGLGGTDLVTYAGRTEDLFVALDDLDQDGASGERDNIHGDVEELTGGSGDDFLIGSFGDNVIRGGGGLDTIDGAGGNDTMYGEAGNDDIVGANGVDTADGGLGNDRCVAETRILCEF